MLDDDTLTDRDVPYDQVARPDDPNIVIHIATSELDSLVRHRTGILEHNLEALGLSVSTGRVVDFRVKEALLDKPLAPGSVPLIYPGHFEFGIVRWPNPGSRKPEALALTAQNPAAYAPDRELCSNQTFLCQRGTPPHRRCVRGWRSH